LLLDGIGNEGETARIHVALVSGPGQAAQELLPIEGLTMAVALDHLHPLGHRPLVGGEAMAALGALAAPASGAVGDATGLEGLGGGVAAGAVHPWESTGA